MAITRTTFSILEGIGSLVDIVSSISSTKNFKNSVNEVTFQRKDASLEQAWEKTGRDLSDALITIYPENSNVSQFREHIKSLQEYNDKDLDDRIKFLLHNTDLEYNEDDKIEELKEEISLLKSRLLRQETSCAR